MFQIIQHVNKYSVTGIAQNYGGAGGGGGATCPEKNGRFPVASQCDAYIECVDGVGEEKLCPEGLLFNAKSPFFSYPCQYPAEVDCEGRSGLRKCRLRSCLA